MLVTRTESVTMPSYPARVKQRLGPLSKEQSSVGQMLAEWVATGACGDRGRADGECGICGHSDTRWEFELENRVTGSRIVDGGSTCITAFGEIAVRDANGKETHNPEEKHAILSRVVSELVRKRNTAVALETVGVVSDRLPGVSQELWPSAGGLELWQTACDRIVSALKGQGRGRSGTKVFPKTFNVFLWAARVTGVSVPAVAFQGIVTLQGRGMEQLREFKMRPRVLRAILPVLTPQQRSAVERAG